MYKTIIYNTEQQTAINDALTELRENCADRCFRDFVDVDRTGALCQRGEQLFAVFGETAYELHNGEFVDSVDDSCVEWVPVIVDGHAIGEWPDEGRSGVLHLLRFTRRRGRNVENPKWFASFLPCGWLHTAEINQSNQQIAENIIEEIADGQAPITGGGLPGWA